uniref:Uncharacterized protein n=1 Tax=Anguilla anguilla TaxID=7936 RepID=A0A0E9TAF4_ANGAN
MGGNTPPITQITQKQGLTQLSVLIFIRSF